MPVHVDHLGHNADLSDAFMVRERVFQVEQGIPGSDDFDGQDAVAEQFIAYDGDVPIGTARYRILPDGVAKVERVAVLSEHRGKKAGAEIMRRIAGVATDQGLKTIVLDAQLSAADFYTNLGYSIDGEPFDEVGIPHVVMSLDISRPDGQA